MNKNTTFNPMLVAMCFVSPTMVLAQTSESTNAAEMITSPGAVNNQLATDQVETPGLVGVNALKFWDEWKAGFSDRTGLDFGIDYNVLGLAAMESHGEDPSAGGVFRVYGIWNLIGRGTLALNSGECVHLFRLIASLQSTLLMMEESTYLRPMTVQSGGSSSISGRHSDIVF